MISRKHVRLQVRSRDNVELVADLVSSGSLVQVRYAATTLAPAIERWLRIGFSDSAPPIDSSNVDPNRTLRRVLPSDPRFLEQLNDYLTRVSGFITRLEVRFPAPFEALFPAGRAASHLPKARWALLRFETKDNRLHHWTVTNLMTSDSDPVASR